MNRVIAYARLLQALPTLDMAARALKDIGAKLPAGRSVVPDRIIELVAEGFQITPDDLRGTRRDKEAALARRVAMYLMRQETSCSLAQIGQALGGRDAAAVTNACKKITSDLESSTFLQTKTREITEKLRPHLKSNGPRASA